MARSPRSRQRGSEAASSDSVHVQAVPPENIQILEQETGLDLRIPPAELRAVLQATSTSISASPYPSGEMLKGYIDSGLPHIADAAIRHIDEEVAHRRSIDTLRAEGSERRMNRGQTAAMCLGFFGVGGSFLSLYFGVPWYAAIIIVIVAVGGPNTATVLARLFDSRFGPRA